MINVRGSAAAKCIRHSNTDENGHVPQCLDFIGAFEVTRRPAGVISKTNGARGLYIVPLWYRASIVNRYAATQSIMLKLNREIIRSLTGEAPGNDRGGYLAQFYHPFECDTSFPHVAPQSTLHNSALVYLLYELCQRRYQGVRFSEWWRISERDAYADTIDEARMLLVYAGKFNSSLTNSTPVEI